MPLFITFLAQCSDCTQICHSILPALYKVSKEYLPPQGAQMSVIRKTFCFEPLENDKKDLPRRAGLCVLSKRPRRVFRESGKESPNHFWPRRVRGQKYISGCKCGNWLLKQPIYARSRLQITGGKAQRAFPPI